MQAPAAEPASAETPGKPRRPWHRRALRWVAGILGSFVVVLALALGTLRVLLHQVPEYRGQIQSWLNETTRLDFRFRGLDARWRVYGPEIYVTDAQVFVPNGGPLLAEAKAASIGVDLWRVLLRAELLAGRIRLIEPEIALVRTPEGRIELKGQAALDPRDENRFNVDDLPTGLLEIEGARLRFEDVQKKLRPLTLSGVNLSIERDRDDIALEGEVELPEKMGGSLELMGSATGKLEDPDTVDWSLELTGREILLAGWREFLGESVRMPLSGSGQLRLNAALHGSRLMSGGLQLKLKDVVVPPRAAPRAAKEASRYPALAGEFSLARVAADWRLQGRGIEISTPGRRWAPSEFTASWRVENGTLAHLEADVEHLLAENLLPLVALAPSSAWRDRVLQLSPQGQLRELKITFGAREKSFPQFSARARLVGVGFEPLARAPGLRGLTGEIDATDAQGRLKVDSRRLDFILPYMFREPLAANARGELAWTRTDEQWHIETHAFDVRNAHASAVADGALSIPRNGESPVLKIDSRFRDAVLVEGWRYLPINHLSKNTLAWLDAAFLSGRAPQGQFFFEGPTRSFPFRNGEGEFRITFPVEGLTLHYGEGWPRIEDIAADIEFRNAGLSGTLRKARSSGLTIEAGSASFADFKKAELAIKARGAGDLSAALGFLQRSPIGTRFGRTFMNLRGAGASAFDLDALLPVTHLDDRNVTVDARFAPGGRVALEGTPHLLEDLQGSLRIQNRFVTSEEGLSASYLGGPVRIELVVERTGELVDDIVRVSGQTSAPALMKALAAPAVLELDGTVDWRAVAHIPVEEQSPRRAASVRIDSNLRGTSVGLPEPFAKAATETRALRADLQWPSATETLLRASYGNVRSQLRLLQRDGAWGFDRGVLRFGEGEVRMPGSYGLELRGSLDRLDLPEWFALGSASAQEAPKRARRAVSDYLRSADLSVRDLGLFGFRFPNVNANLLAGDRAWSVSVEGPRARGTVLVPYDFAGQEPLTLNLARLSIGDADDLAAEGAARDTAKGDDKPAEEEPDPRQWPSVRASIGQFEAWGKRLGFVRAELVHAADGLRLETFSTRAGSFATNGSGSWIVTPDGTRGALKFRLESSNVLETLQDLGYGASLSGKKGIMEADLSWPGAPTASLAGRLSGTVRIEADDGKLLNVEPGAGRVFGLMSVAALPRRLTLDFRDFLTKGLSYDRIRGDFRLDSGNAFTENLLLKGPAAEIGIVGRTGLETRDYDQTAVVTGSIGNSLPVAGALAGGPALGAALLLFTQIFKEPLKGIARGYYRITGPWENPSVQRVDSSEGKDAVRTAEGSTETGN